MMFYTDIFANRKALAFTRDFALARTLAFARVLAYTLAFTRAFAGAFAFARAFVFALVLALTLTACSGGGGGGAASGGGNVPPQTTPIPVPDPDTNPGTGGTNMTPPPPGTNNPGANPGGGTPIDRDNMTMPTANMTMPTTMPPMPKLPDGYMNLLGKKSVGVLAAANDYLNTQEFKNQGRNGGDHTSHLVLHNFHYAYQRGWTGNGSLVVVADTGANTNHKDLRDNINTTQNFIGSDSIRFAGPQTAAAIRERSWHGTAVAGVVAGVRDGDGIHGVAYDAKLAIAKLGRDPSHPIIPAFPDLSRNLPKVYTWAKELNATVINHSLTSPADPTYLDSLVEIETGSWYSTDLRRIRTSFALFDYRPHMNGRDGYANAKEYARRARNNAGNETVFVIGAGNNPDQPYSYSFPQMATATNDTGGLILDGRVIIAGWWDTRGYVRGNRAGNICTTWDNNTQRCLDAAKISDFYILADGQVYSTWNRGDKGIYRDHDTRRGSSYSAPIVSGAVAIIHQMWPHMKGKHIVQLLLDTADNASIENYKEHEHGQGLLDMKAATDPVGAVGIPLGNTTNGTSRLLSLAGGVRLVGGLSAEAEAALGEVMLLDTYHRDFYFDLGTAVTTTPPPSFAGYLAGNHYAGNYYAGNYYAGNHNYYAHYLPPDQHVQFAPITLGGGRADGLADGEAGGLGDGEAGGLGGGEAGGGAGGEAGAKAHRFQLGFGTSYGHVLGNAFSGVLGTSRHSHTLYGLYNYNYGGGAGGANAAGDTNAAGGAGGGAGAGTGAYGQLGLGVSYTEFDKAGSLLAEAELMVSSTATAGYGFALPGEGRLDFSISQPITLERARLHYDVPVARTLEGEVVRESRVVDFKTDAGQRPLDVGVEYQLPLHWGGEGVLSAFAEARTRGLDFGDEATDNRFGVRFANQF